MKLPLRISTENVGSALDADGCEVFVVDHNGELPDDEVQALAKSIVGAVNVHGTLSQPLSRAAADILAERARQIAGEGWTPEHDDEHGQGQLARAASAYAYFGALSDDERRWGFRGYSHTYWLIGQLFPNWGTAYGGWDWKWWKPKSRRQDLVRSAALLIAEIERMDRAAARAAAVQS